MVSFLLTKEFILIINIYEKSIFFTLIFHFDDTYFFQENLRSIGIEIDLRDISGTKYMCSFENLEKIEKRIPKIERKINFLGKGDYHYLTYLFLRKIDILFALLVVDHHIDIKKTFEGYISCGSWLLEAIKIKTLKKIILISSYEKLEGKICIIKFDYNKIENLIKDLPVYISIDKDILDKSYINTSWDQGNLSLDQLLSLFLLFQRGKILGIDVCGEPAFNIYEYKKSEKINLEIWKTINNITPMKISA